MRQAGPFAVNLQTRVDQTQAVQAVESTLKDFVANGPAPDELEMARRNITGGFPLRIDSNGELVRYLAAIGFYHLPLDYLQTFTSRIEALSLEQVKAALQRRIQPARQLTVIVGGS